MQLNEIAKINAQDLKSNTYPGRGIIIGKSPDSKKLMQIYWIMGRSANSRNRVFAMDGEFVRTKAYDESAVSDPSLIIYYPVRNVGNCHIVTNGDQTDTIFDYIKNGQTFEDALKTRTFEPDGPNFTPRISGMVDIDKLKDGYALSVLKSQRNNPAICLRNFFFFESSLPGYGHCIHTYDGDGEPLPSFGGEPYTVNIFDTIEENAEYYWKLINKDNKVSLLVKGIDIASGEFSTTIINKFNR